MRVVSSAAAWLGIPSTVFMLFSKRGTRLLLPSNTRLRRFRSSTVVRTSASVTFITGARAVFWLQPDVSALTDSGYASGTVCCFSTSTANTRASSGVRVRMGGREGASGVEFMLDVAGCRYVYSDRASGIEPGQWMSIGA